jgi:dTDP-4-dehydrorhamnose reductase
MRVAVTGKTGQVVTALKARVGNAEIIPIGRPELDLGDARNIGALLKDIRPDAIVSAAAYTAVDKAETDAAAAQAVNALAPAFLAEAASSLDIPIVHISTDYVFDGSKPEPYVESDPTAPVGVYGSTKRAGEVAVGAATPNHAILRTAWVYSPFGRNFVKTMLCLARERPLLSVVADQVGNPTSAFDIADAVLQVVSNLIASPQDAGLRGVFHMTAQGQASWFDFAREIMACSAELGGPHAEVVPIGTADYPTPARRPPNSRLVSARLAERHGVLLPDWHEALRPVILRLVRDTE